MQQVLCCQFSLDVVRRSDRPRQELWRKQKKKNCIKENENVSEKIYVGRLKRYIPLIASRAKYFTSISWSVASFSRTGLTSACKALLKTSLLVLLVCLLMPSRYKRVQAAII